MGTQFDDQLQQRLIAFQQQHGLSADGVVDTATWQALASVGAGQAAAQPTQPTPTQTPIQTGQHHGGGHQQHHDSHHDHHGHHGSNGVPSGCRKTAKACFSISEERAWLLRPGQGNAAPTVVAAVRALGGRPGHPTPQGHFNVIQHDRNHHSNLYHNAPMPFYVQFAPAVGFHTGSLSEHSHGCVHLSSADAEHFFTYLQDGDQVDVVP